MSKALQGHRTKFKKRQKRRQSVVAGRQQLYCAVQSRSPSHWSNNDRKSSLQFATERRRRRCIPDRRRQAVPLTCQSHWEGTVTECFTLQWLEN